MGPRILNGKLKTLELQEMMFNGKLKGLEIARRDGIMVHRLQSRALAKQYIWLFCPFFCPFVLLRMIHNALWRNRWCRSHDTFIPLGTKLRYKTTQEIVHTFTLGLRGNVQFRAVTIFLIPRVDIECYII